VNDAANSRPIFTWAPLLLAAWLATFVTVDYARAADAPQEVPGMSDAMSTSEIALAWAILRGPSEATTTVVVRMLSNPTQYPWMGVVAVDPFSKREQPVRATSTNPGVTDVHWPRSRSADFPRTEFRLYDSEPSAKTGTPAVVVVYLGVPDTTPEFTTDSELQRYLTDRIIRLRNQALNKKS
jgi:hypothetical protein